MSTSKASTSLAKQTLFLFQGLEFIFYYLMLFIHSFIYLVSGDRVSLYSSGHPGTESVDQADLKLIHLPLPAER